MNILIDINHPAHVHLYKNVYKNLINNGHNVYVVVKNIPSAIKILELEGIPYINIGNKNDNLLLKGLSQLIYNCKIWNLVRKNKISIGIGSSINLPHVSYISSMVSIISDDDDDDVEPLFANYAHPFSDVIISPIGTKRKTKKIIYIPSYHELSYLHPNKFVPNISVLDDANIKYIRKSDGTIDVEKFFILRFNAFKAHHDVGVVGLSIENKRKLIDYLSNFGKVFITTERNVDVEFKRYQLNISQEKIHSLIYYSTMLIGDSQTMTSEAAVLGTPAIRCNTFVGRIQYLNEEEDKYGLTYGFTPDNSELMFKKIEELLKFQNLKEKWQTRRQKMLSEKIDYAKFLTWFIENYPASKEESMKASSEFWDRFR